MSSGDLGLTFVDWGAQFNLTLEELVGKVTNFDFGTPELFGYRNEEDIDVNYEIRFLAFVMILLTLTLVEK